MTATVVVVEAGLCIHCTRKVERPTPVQVWRDGLGLLTCAAPYPERRHKVQEPNGIDYEEAHSNG